MKFDKYVRTERRKSLNVIYNSPMPGFKPAYACYCETCGINWELEFTRIRGTSNADLNYCPTCGNELTTP